VEDVMDRRKWKNLFLDIIFDIIGAILYDIGIYCFAVNAKFAPAGVSGIAVITSYLLGLPMGRLALLFNIPIVIIIYRILGRKFVLKTIKTMLIFAFILDYIIPFLPSDVYGKSILCSHMYRSIYGSWFNCYIYTGNLYRWYGFSDNGSKEIISPYINRADNLDY
jgi:uncharacterized membrane-anchored protein YitT (DUF2179 family)